ncbi:hypothetical protein Pnap_4643 (plasmid) [Polaromonas naphthalenivorans CJ2]|uniref:Transposase Tn5 dimerisation domain-containing protein n=1 Tax=Polaromonas naphthalenivorans (strain CJ2) TaxID=365044 RepID=A1VWN2_POLNA|nr:hypothetical protein Pnap_4643 [Polaromonas naphthalenivorans CJ2]
MVSRSPRKFCRKISPPAFILNQKRPPDTPPKLNEVVHLVARLGGFLARKGDGELSVKIIWLGMQRILDFLAGVRELCITK